MLPLIRPRVFSKGQFNKVLASYIARLKAGPSSLQLLRLRLIIRPNGRLVSPTKDGNDLSKERLSVTPKGPKVSVATDLNDNDDDRDNDGVAARRRSSILRGSETPYDGSNGVYDVADLGGTRNAPSDARRLMDGRNPAQEKAIVMIWFPSLPILRRLYKNWKVLVRERRSTGILNPSLASDTVRS